MSGGAADDDLAIIDAHHHYWDLSLKAHPWLVEEPPIPFRYGDYAAIRVNFLPGHYRRAAARHRVVATVTMEAEWREDRLVDETRWMAYLCASFGVPAAHVARTILHQDGAAEALVEHARFSFVKGIRHKPAVIATPGPIPWKAPGSLSDPAWRRGYAALEANGLHFELQAPWWHVDELLDLVSAHPATPVVINHAFLPSDRSAAGLASWRAAVRRAASIPNAAMKISGIGLKGRPWSLADNRVIIGELIEMFGTRRCLFASNFPVDGLCGSLDTLWSGYKEVTRDLSAADRRALFHDNAKRVYRLDSIESSRAPAK